MHRLAVSTILFLTATSVVSGQLPCNSPLRLVLPHFFRHCSCEYAEWSEWIGTSVINVLTHQCASGEAINETRRQKVIVGIGCSERTETRQICAPELVDRLILALGLGSSGQHISSSHAPQERIGLPGPPIIYNNQQICHHIYSTIGKRSLQKERKVNIRKPDNSKPYLKPLENDPIPFDMTLHGSRYRRKITCYPDNTQYILFMLDTSGSIGQDNFEAMTSTLGRLVPLFCRPIRIGVMTFNHEYYVEFCFDFYDNKCQGREDAGDAISEIDYRSGNTHTGGAVQCACDFMLSPDCGLPPGASCIDVVVITDGLSNGPRPVCDQVQCLHDRYGVETYAIGIGIANQIELDCISNHTSDPFNLFAFESFANFQSNLTVLLTMLGTQDPETNTKYTCVDPQIALGTNGCR